MGRKEDQMNILVTGGGGFIGRSLVNKLLDLGHTVSVLSRGDYPELEEAGANIIQADIVDKSQLMTSFTGHDLVYHIAAKTGFWGPYCEYYQTNVLGTLNVIDACLHSKISHLVYISSASVVFAGKSIEGANEDIPYPSKPLSHYTGTKAIAERAVLNANSKEFKTISLRPHLVWGPGDKHILPRIVERAKSGKLRIVGSGKNIVDTTYIDNFTQAQLCVLNAVDGNEKAWGKAYFISDDEPVKLWDMVNRLLDVSGIDPVKKRISTRAAINTASILEKQHSLRRKKQAPPITRFLVHELSSSHWFNISRAKNILGYKPIVSIDEGLAQMHEPRVIYDRQKAQKDVIQSHELSDERVYSLSFLKKINYLEGKKLSLKSLRFAWKYLRKTSSLIQDGAQRVGNEATETKAMAAVFFRMLETKLDLKNRKEPPSEEEVKEAINQLKDVGRFSLFATVSILPGGGFSLIGLELLARKLGINGFTLVPSSFRKKEKP